MRINQIDNFDSYAPLIRDKLISAGGDVKLIRSDVSLDSAISGNPELIVFGPGPNGPKDTGNYKDIMDEVKGEIPVFGICLGHQFILDYFGQPIVKLSHEEVIHGEDVSTIHNGKGIFDGIVDDKGMNKSYFARYNSLGTYDVPDCFEVTARTESGLVLAIQHKEMSIIGVQFHPESHLSSMYNAGEKLFRNLLALYSK